MAKLTAVLMKHHNSNAVKIRISHLTKSSYIDTGIVATPKDVSKGKLRQSFIAQNLSALLNKYNDILLQLKWSLPNMDVGQVKSELLKRSAGNNEAIEVDFLVYFAKHIEKVKTKGIFITAYNALSAYMAGTKLMATDITSKFLLGFESYLLKNAKKNSKGTAVHCIMREVKTVFNCAVNDYNNEDNGVIAIPNNPYRKYKLPKLKVTAKRALNIEQIRQVRDLELQEGSHIEMIRDLCMLSFYLCGINAVDLYNGVKLVNGRIEYCRTKTKNKRRDNAFISVKLVDEAKPLFDKYIASGLIQRKYLNSQSLNMTIQYYLKQLGIPNLQFYSFRHSFATIARNDLRFSKDDIAMALNHVDNTNSVTDIYIKKDWTIIDDVQAGVISYLNNLKFNSWI